ncbi:hypothetical protein Tcan_15165 [Toxocara canis]|uniref:Uncharacterized protein n=1 Tax=Toxocara canis TaxID=6265 RepID=A0A0B2UQ90_TOXCA|nr:hypothetical protein Tcan_15165 [Toxocara canis]
MVRQYERSIKIGGNRSPNYDAERLSRELNLAHFRIRFSWLLHFAFEKADGGRSNRAKTLSTIVCDRRLGSPEWCFEKFDGTGSFVVISDLLWYYLLWQVLFYLSYRRYD